MPTTAIAPDTGFLNSPAMGSTSRCVIYLLTAFYFTRYYRCGCEHNAYDVQHNMCKSANFSRRTTIHETYD